MMKILPYTIALVFMLCPTSVVAQSIFDGLDPNAKSAQLLIDGIGEDDILYWDFAFAPDGETLFFGTGTAEGEKRRILMRRWLDGHWTKPEAAPFSNLEAAEGTPVMGGDGNWLYFSSDRHAGQEPENKYRDLYRVSKSSGWHDVERVTNTPLYGEITLSTARNGNGLLWTDRRLDGERQMGLYEVQLDSNGSLSDFKPLYDLHKGDPSGENYAWISPDGSYALFLNYNIFGGGTEEDIFLIRREKNKWSKPKGLGPGVNTRRNESSPSVSPDGRFLLFGSKRGTKDGYFYIPLSELTLFNGEN